MYQHHLCSSRSRFIINFISVQHTSDVGIFSRVRDNAQLFFATCSPWRELLGGAPSSQWSSFARPYTLGEATFRLKQNLNCFRVNYAMFMLLILFLESTDNHHDHHLSHHKASDFHRFLQSHDHLGIDRSQNMIRFDPNYHLLQSDRHHRLVELNSKPSLGQHAIFVWDMRKITGGGGRRSWSTYRNKEEDDVNCDNREENLESVSRDEARVESVGGGVSTAGVS